MIVRILESIPAASSSSIVEKWCSPSCRVQSGFFFGDGFQELFHVSLQICNIVLKLMRGDAGTMI
jgi:hypothetical protein